MAQTKGKARTRDLTATHRRLLEAGRHEFAAFGLEGARVDRIAKKADLNKSMIYYIFGGKDELYLACLESLFEQKSRAFDVPIGEGGVAIDALPKLMWDFVDMFMQNRETSRMLLYDIAAGAPFLRKLKKKRPELFKTFDVMSTILADWMDAEAIRRLDADKSIVMVAMVVLCLPVMLPSFDILRPRRSRRHAALADPQGWRTFLGELMSTILQPR